MKCYYLFAVLLLTVFYVQATKQSVGLEDAAQNKKECDEVHNHVEEFVGNKVLACINVSPSIPVSNRELEEFFKAPFNFTVRKDFCSKERPKLRRCFYDIINTECGDKLERYFPGFAADALNTLLDYLCADNGAVIQKISEEATRECVGEILFSRKGLYGPCEAEFNQITFNVRILTKSLACQFLSAGKSCYPNFIKQRCPKIQGLKDILKGIISAVSSPCDINP